MITIQAVCMQLGGLPEGDVRAWIERDLVRAERHDEEYLFQEIDVARVRLIAELRDEMHVEDETLPVVLNLLDRLYEERRRLRRLRALLERAPASLRHELLQVLSAEG